MTTDTAPLSAPQMTSLEDYLSRLPAEQRQAIVDGGKDVLIDALSARVAELEKLVYVPGLWKCAKCGFQLVQRNLNAANGAVTARDNPGDRCPNCDVPLWRVTERDAGNEMSDRCVEQMDRARAAEARATQAEAREAGLREALEPFLVAAAGMAEIDMPDDAAVLRASADWWLRSGEAGKKGRPLTFGDFRKLAALSASPAQGGQTDVRGRVFRGPVVVRETDRSQSEIVAALHGEMHQSAPYWLEQLVADVEALTPQHLDLHGLRSAQPAAVDPLVFTYTNWRGERGTRRAIPIRVYRGATEYHHEPQWLMEAHDLGKGAVRVFAMRDMGPAQGADIARELAAGASVWGRLCAHYFDGDSWEMEYPTFLDMGRDAGLLVDAVYDPDVHGPINGEVEAGDTVHINSALGRKLRERDCAGGLLTTETEGSNG